jgi:hypothetical protein
VSKLWHNGGSKRPYSVGTTRVQTGRGPLDLLLFLGRYLASLEQVRDKVGDGSSLGLPAPAAAECVIRITKTYKKRVKPCEATHHLVEHKLVRLVGHFDQRVPPLARDLVETTAWEPFRDEAERWEEVDGEETGGEKDVELVRRLVSDADQVVVLSFGPVAVGYTKDDDAHRPAIKKSISIGIHQRKEGAPPIR